MIFLFRLLSRVSCLFIFFSTYFPQFLLFAQDLGDGKDLLKKYQTEQEEFFKHNGSSDLNLKGFFIHIKVVGGGGIPVLKHRLCAHFDGFISHIAFFNRINPAPSSSEIIWEEKEVGASLREVLLLLEVAFKENYALPDYTLFPRSFLKLYHLAHFWQANPQVYENLYAYAGAVLSKKVYGPGSFLNSSHLLSYEKLNLVKPTCLPVEKFLDLFHNNLKEGLTPSNALPQNAEEIKLDPLVKIFFEKYLEKYKVSTDVFDKIKKYKEGSTLYELGRLSRLVIYGWYYPYTTYTSIASDYEALNVTQCSLEELNRPEILAFFKEYTRGIASKENYIFLTYCSEKPVIFKNEHWVKRDNNSGGGTLLYYYIGKIGVPRFPE